MTEHPIEQAVRRSHCAHNDREDPRHQCIGSCNISPQGVTLSCDLCGDAHRPIEISAPETRLVSIVLEALGISPEAVTPEYKSRAAEAAKRWIAARR